MLSGKQQFSVVNHSAPKVVEDLIREAEAADASDIHLQMNGKTATVAFRLDGLMTPGRTLDDTVAELVFGRIKYLARLKTYQASLPQDGRIERADVAARNDLRVSTYPTVTGEKIVLRMFNTSDNRGLGDLGLQEDTCRALESFLRGYAGLLLLTGPAGSGKTTTIYACLRHLATVGRRHIITVEDPVEQIVPGIMQTEVNAAIGLDYARAARHLLRQDPEVLVIGEIRDDETARLAVRAALTGHLVISTLHAGSCRGVYERLMVMCPDHYAVISAIALVLNQRLLRRVCPRCQTRGCDDCLQSGYRGRTPAVEWLRVDDPLRVAIRSRGPEAIEPLKSLRQVAGELAAAGQTSEAEIQRIFGE